MSERFQILAGITVGLFSFFGAIGLLGPSTDIGVPLIALLEHKPSAIGISTLTFASYYIKIIAPAFLCVIAYLLNPNSAPSLSSINAIRAIFYIWYIIDLITGMALAAFAPSVDFVLATTGVVFLWGIFWLGLAKLVADNQKFRFQRLVVWSVGVIITGFSIWSLNSMRLVTSAAEAIAGNLPYCLSIEDTAPQYREIQSVFDLRPTVMFNKRSGYKDTQHAFFHGLLNVNDKVIFHWSYREGKFFSIGQPSKEAVGACAPKAH